MRNISIEVEYIDRAEYNRIASHVGSRVCETEYPRQYVRIVNPTRVDSGRELYDLFRGSLPNVNLFWVPSRASIKEAKRLFQSGRKNRSYYIKLFEDALLHGKLVVEYEEYKRDRVRDADDFIFLSNAKELVLSRFRVTREHFDYYCFDPPLQRDNFTSVLGIREV